MEGKRWNPWRELRRRTHLHLEWTFLRNARGLWTPHPDGTATIHLDPRLGRRERRCVLAHELIHDERGITYMADARQELVQAEERWVWAEAVRRLVPADELAALVESVAPDPVTVLDIADWFDVDWNTARRACAQLG